MNQAPSTARVSGVMDEALGRFAEGVDRILSDDEATYIKSLVDPFHTESVGTRVPSLNPVDTYTNTQFESFTISSSEMSASGKILLVFNPTAIRPRPVLVLKDPTGALFPLSSSAPIVKDVR